MSIYGKLLQTANNGGYYKIDLRNKTLKIGGKTYVEKGNILVDESLIENCDFEKWEIIKGDVEHYSWKNMIAHLFEIYKFSVPSKKKDRSYFKALPVEELTDYDLAYGIDRHYAQACLEGYILLAGISNWIIWDEPSEHWFWQDKDDCTLIVLKEWIM